MSVARHATAVAGLLQLAVWAGCEQDVLGSAESVADDSKAEPATAAPDDAVPAAASVDPTPAPLATPAPPALPTSADAGACPEGKDDTSVGILVSPARRVVGERLTVVVASLDGEDPLALRLELDGEVEAERTYRRGVPAATIARFVPEQAGKLTVVAGRGKQGLRCATVNVRKHGGIVRPDPALEDAVWPVKRKWSAGEEALYSAWVRELFHAPRGEDLAYKKLDEVTSDPARNVLFDHLSWGEDQGRKQTGLYLKPDCADAPYFLRAYFAWKRRLPFGFRMCTRGRGGKAPSCGSLRHVLRPPDTGGSYAGKAGELSIVQRYFRKTLAWGVHSGNGRTAFGDDGTDLYPVELSRRSVRPGTVYADPYGHIFVVVELFDADGERPGVLYAIDGQPDGSITRKRFWEGNFLWNPDPALGGSGFKAFRPLFVEGSGDERSLVALGDKGVGERAGYGDASAEQASIQGTDFYDRMDGLITPGKRDPFAAQEEIVRALYEAAKVRVTSVQNGVEHHRDHRGSVVKMPEGHAIFETTGAWENFSTPARDLRILIAIDVVQGFDEKVERRPDLYGVGAGDDLERVRTELGERRAELLASPELQFSYQRSDGSSWTLSLVDLIARASALEVGYNPNDCPEVRWGAPKGSDERKTCKRRAPDDQQRKMTAYRPWFVDRRRPPRGDPGPPIPD